MGRDGKSRRGGKERKGRDGGGMGKVTEGMEGTGEIMGHDGGRERRKGRRGATASANFNSWRRH